MSAVATELLEIPGDFVFAKQLSIVLIGPDELRRRDVTGVLAEYPGIQVREFSSYPADVGAVSRLLARQFDIVLVDLDSDRNAAFDLVESLRGETAVTVMVYTEEADPELMSRCARAGAREHLVLPVRQSTLDKVLASARIGLLSKAQPAPKATQPASRPEPQVVAIPKPKADAKPERQAVAIPAIPDADVLREKMLPAYAQVQREDEILRPVIRAVSQAQPAPKPEPERQVIAIPRMDVKPEPQMTAIPAIPKADVPREKPLPVSAPVHRDDEVLRPATRAASQTQPTPKPEPEPQAIAIPAIPQVDVLREKPLPVTAPDGQPAASPERVTARVTARPFNEASPSPRRTAGVVVEEMRYTPETTPLAPVKEDSLEKLRAVAEAYNAGSAASPRTTATRVITEVSVAPPKSKGARRPDGEPRGIFESVQETPATESAVEIGTLSFHSDLDDLGDEDDEDAKRKKWVRIGAVSFVVLVLLIFIGPRLLNPPRHTLAAQSAQMRPVSDVLDGAEKTSKPSPSTMNGHRSGAASARQASTGQPGTNVEEAILPNADSRTASLFTAGGAKSASSQVDSTLMNGQLASAPRIPTDVKTRHTEEAPPSASFAASNTEEIAAAGAVDSVLAGQAHPAVRYVPAPPVVIPVEVAEKLLIHKTLPTYPPTAWNNYVSGKVVVEAVVSETGTVESLKIVSGPKVFQQAALDAVKAWRYKPYVVNGRPARVQTTATLVFDPYKK